MQEKHGQWSCIDNQSFATSFDDLNSIEKALSELKSLNQKKMRVIVGIPIAKTMIQQLSVDASLSQHDTFQFLKTQIKPLFGQSNDTLCWDYETISETTAQRNMVLVATPKMSIIRLQNAMQKNNLDMTAIEPDLLALARFLAQTLQQKNCCVLLPNENNFIALTIHNGKLKNHEVIEKPDQDHLTSAILLTTKHDQRKMPTFLTIFIEDLLQKYGLQETTGNTYHTLSALGLCARSDS